MRLENERQSTNIEDRRGRRLGGPVGIGGGGIGMILVILLVSWLTGTNPLSLLQMTEGVPTQGPAESVPTGTAGDDPQSQFIGAVVADLEDTWGEIFARAGERYQPPVLVLFDGQVHRPAASRRRRRAVHCPADKGLPRPFVLPRADQQFGAQATCQPAWWPTGGAPHPESAGRQ
jgi:predicted metalloprotease